MLAKKAFDMKAIFYLVLYNLIFVTPMLIISIAVYKEYDPDKAEEMRQKRLCSLHLIAGILMISIGAAMLLGYV